jgi:hypothetical protein
MADDVSILTIFGALCSILRFETVNNGVKGIFFSPKELTIFLRYQNILIFTVHQIIINRT